MDDFREWYGISKHVPYEVKSAKMVEVIPQRSNREKYRWELELIVEDGSTIKRNFTTRENYDALNGKKIEHALFDFVVVD